MVGDPVSVTREYRSTISQRHADQRALELARTEALKILQCKFVATACQITHCLVTAGTVVSNFDDHFTVEYLHDPPLPPQIGDTIELLSPDGFSFFGQFLVLDVFGEGNATIQIQPSPGATIPVGTAAKYFPRVCCEKSSTLSQDDAIDKASACVNAHVVSLCDYGDLIPIGSEFL